MANITKQILTEQIKGGTDRIDDLATKLEKSGDQIRNYVKNHPDDFEIQEDRVVVKEASGGEPAPNPQIEELFKALGFEDSEFRALLPSGDAAKENQPLYTQDKAMDLLTKLRKRFMSKDDEEKTAIRYYAPDYFGINRGEATTGGYDGLSFTVFPVLQGEKETQKTLFAVTVNVGTNDYGTDFYLAHQPSTRRMWKTFLDRYQKLCVQQAGKPWYRIKADLCDNKTAIDGLRIDNPQYQKTTLLYAVVDLGTPEGQVMFLGFFVKYCEMVGWGGRDQKSNQKAVTTLLGNLVEEDAHDWDNEELATLTKELNARRFVVLQGAPGTGKTRLARRAVKELALVDGKLVPSTQGNGISTFIQFHAETSYTDFVYGLQPSLKEGDLGFQGREGVLLKAIRAAMDNKDKPDKPGKPVFLIIDEINRANLSNVLGPAFYLFEEGLKGDAGDPEVELVPKTSFEEGLKEEGDPEAEQVPKTSPKSLSIKALPANLYVIATMNTADRSLAVVDFALRRRFSWITLVPHKITPGEGYWFDGDTFDQISSLFDRYATDEELNLKPGPAYFLVKDEEGKEERMNDRLQYEVMPLIKEYLVEGMLSDGKEDFFQYFVKRIGQEMFQ